MTAPTRHRMLVTGDSGFVGTLLGKHLAQRHDVEVLPLIDPQSGLRADLRDAEAVKRAVLSARPDAVLHLAGIAAPREANADPALAWDVNFMGTFRLAQAVRETAPNAHLVNIGSAEAYGLAFNTGAPVSEDAPLQPVTTYGATKAAAETMLLQMARTGLNITLFRSFNHSAGGQPPQFVIPAFAQQIALIEAGRQEPVIVVGDLSARRDFLDARDVVRLYADTAMNPPDASGRVYNVSTGAPIAIADVLDMLRSMSRVQTEVRVDLSRSGDKNPVPVTSGDPRRAADELGWRPQISTRDMLTGVLDYWRQRVAEEAQP